MLNILQKSVAFALLCTCSLPITYSAQELSSSSEEDAIFISNPLVLLVGASKYDTQPDLPSVKKEMTQLYELFKNDYGYEVRTTYFNKAGEVVSDKHNVVHGDEEEMKVDDANQDLYKGRLSVRRFDDFLLEQSSHLYNSPEHYDALIFIFSGHGSGSRHGHDMILLSDFFVQNRKPNNYKYVADIRQIFTEKKFDHFFKHFSKKPKLFFNLACRGGTGGKGFTVKLKKGGQYKGVTDEYEEANVVTYYTTTPGKKTDAEIGLKYVQLLRNQMQKVLNQKGKKKSLQGLINSVTKKIREKGGCPSLSGPLACYAHNIFFVKGIDVNKGNDEVCTPLWFAAARGDTAKCRYLVAKGADVNKGNDEVYTPLWFAAARGDTGLLDKLVKEQGINIHAKDREGMDALLYASMMGERDMVDHLVNTYGMRVTSKEKDGRDALLVACQAGQKDMMDHLFFYHDMSVKDSRDKNNYGALSIACLYGQIEVIDHLAVHYNVLPSGGDYAIYKKFEKKKVVKHLENKYGLGPKEESKDPTPASDEEEDEVFTSLLDSEKTVPIRVRPDSLSVSSGAKPLHSQVSEMTGPIAAKKKVKAHKSSSKYSEQTLAYAKELKKYSRRAIFHASRAGNNDVFDCLVDRFSMKPAYKDEYGCDAMTFACREGHNKTIDHLARKYKMVPQKKHYEEAKKYGKKATVKHLQQKYGIEPKSLDGSDCLIC